MSILFLYSKPTCHLCEQAQALLQQLDLTFEVINIEEGDLIAHYGERIPVVQRKDNHQELDWPFNAVLLNEFMSG